MGVSLPIRGRLHMTTQERFERIQRKVNEDKSELERKKVEYSLKKQEYDKQKLALEAEGIVYSSGKELKEIHEEQVQRLQMLMNKAEETLGLSADTEDSELDEFDF